MDLITQSTQKINEKLGNAVENLPKSRQRQMKARLKKLLIKQFIIKNIYNNICATCGKQTNLPAFEFHHIDNSKKDKEWLKMYNLNVRKTMENIIEENCVLICNNCHELIHSRFKEFYPDVIIKADDKLYKENTLIQYLPNIKKQIESIHENLGKYKKLKIADLDHRLLKIDLRVRESSKTIYDVYEKFIYEVIKLNRYNEFTKKDLMDLTGTSRPSVRDQIFKLISSGILKEVITPKYIHKVGRTKVYELTEKGIKRVKQKYNDLPL
jgi:hypothetical protein